MTIKIFQKKYFLELVKNKRLKFEKNNFKTSEKIISEFIKNAFVWCILSYEKLEKYGRSFQASVEKIFKRKTKLNLLELSQVNRPISSTMTTIVWTALDHIPVLRADHQLPSTTPIDLCCRSPHFFFFFWGGGPQCQYSSTYRYIPSSFSVNLVQHIQIFGLVSVSTRSNTSRYPVKAQ